MMSVTEVGTQFRAVTRQTQDPARQLNLKLPKCLAGGDKSVTLIMVPPPETQVEHHLGVLARTGVARPALEDALTTIVDAAIELTHAQQGVLLLAKSSGNLEVTVARDAQRVSLPLHQVQISSAVLRRVMGSRRELIVTEAEEDSPMARRASIGALGLHSILVIPVDKLPLAEAR